MEKKIIVMFIVCTIAALLLAACAPSAAAPSALPSEEPAGSTENAEDAFTGTDPSTWGPTEHTSLEEAETDAGIELTLPDEIAGLKPTVFLTWYERAYIDAVYTDSDGESMARVRKAAGDTDVSGDYNEYAEISEESIDGMNVTFKGENGKIMLAIWTDSGYTYAVAADAGISADDMSALVRLVK